jgi:hypothetical protein
MDDTPACGPSLSGNCSFSIGCKDNLSADRALAVRRPRMMRGRRTETAGRDEWMVKVFSTPNPETLNPEAALSIMSFGV